MVLPEEGYLLRIFIGESDKHDGKPLYEWIVLKARQEGLAGATVLRGMMGFGAHSRIHTFKIERLSEDLPIIIEIVDTREKLEKFLSIIDNEIEEGLVLQAAPHAQCEPPAWDQDTTHFAQRCRAVREELQPLVTAHQVEGGLSKGQRRRVPFAPLDRWPIRMRNGARHGQHGRVEIEADHVPGRADAGGGRTGDRAGAAGEIEHALARARRGDLDQILPPRIPKRRHHVALACLRNAHATKLPS